MIGPSHEFQAFLSDFFAFFDGHIRWDSAVAKNHPNSPSSQVPGSFARAFMFTSLGHYLLFTSNCVFNTTPFFSTQIAQKLSGQTSRSPHPARSSPRPDAPSRSRRSRRVPPAARDQRFLFVFTSDRRSRMPRFAKTCENALVH